MHRQILPSLLLLAILGLPLAAQEVDYAISNEFRYGIGEQTGTTQTDRKEYLEDVLNSRIFVGDVTLGFRIEAARPREYGRDTIGLTEYFAEYRRDQLRVRGGTFYNLVGRGLVMNTFEQRPIGFDTRTTGARLDYEGELLSVGAWGGVLTYADIVNPKRLEEYLIRGASGEVRPIPQAAVGGSFMAATGQKTTPGFSRQFDSYLREVFVRGAAGGFRTYLNFADKRTILDSSSRTRTASQFNGYGAYGLLGYGNEALAVTAELKDYRFDLLPPSEQQVGSRATRALPFQNPPSLIPEHDKTLLARNPHTPDYSDELGFQFETLLYPAEEMTVTLLALGGSRHNAWERREVVDSGSGETKIVYDRVNDAPRSFAELSDARYSPYWEAFGQVEYLLNDEQSFALALQRRDNVDASLSETSKATTLMLESLTDLSSRDNLHAILELQRVFESKKVTVANDSLGIEAFDGRYYNALLTLEYTQSPTWSVNTRIEWSSYDKEIDERQIWPVVGATYRLGTAHTINVQYGSERGGVVCTGGVCRQINPFTGFRLSVISRL